MIRQQLAKQNDKLQNLFPLKCFHALVVIRHNEGQRTKYKIVWTQIINYISDCEICKWLN